MLLIDAYQRHQAVKARLEFRGGRTNVREWRLREDVLFVVSRELDQMLIENLIENGEQLPGLSRTRAEQNPGGNMCLVWTQIPQYRKYGPGCGRWLAKTVDPPRISHNNHTTSDPHIVAELFPQHFAYVGSSHNYSTKFLMMRPTLEAIHLNFTPDIEHYYNSPITMREVLVTLKQCRNTAPSEDGIRYEMLQHLNIMWHSATCQRPVSHTIQPSRHL